MRVTDRAPAPESYGATFQFDHLRWLSPDPPPPRSENIAKYVPLSPHAIGRHGAGGRPRRGHAEVVAFSLPRAA